jgi:hypothetical protein
MLQADTRATLLRIDRNPARRSIVGAMDRTLIDHCHVASIQIIYRLLLLIDSATRWQEVCHYLAGITRFVKHEIE